MTTSELGAQGRDGVLGAVARRAKRDLPFFLVAGAIFVLDQITKAIVRGNLAIGESWPSDGWLVKITHVTNDGAAFGVLQGQGLFLTITAVIAIGAIVFYYAFPPMEHGLLRMVMGLMLGGALGNLIDRLRFGEVTDFIDFPRYPEFNVADSSISVGLFLLVVFYVLSERRPEPQSDD
ncbi:MAG TPA: signal peptidase II [Dehalococcoidia bacterium]|nr:signal peptidase II [Dehalococcoidia bacterium]